MNALQQFEKLDPNTRVLAVVSALSGGAMLAFFVGGPHLVVLTMGASILLLAILALWNSVRSLTGEIEVEPALIEAQNHIVSSRANEKDRVLRALKDLENEHAIGKLDDADFKAVSAKYREEAKDLLREIDAEVAPHREKAEALAAKYLKEHLEEKPAKKSKKGKEEVATKEEDTATSPESANKKDCPSCGVKNDVDAKFCKACAASMSTEKTS